MFFTLASCSVFRQQNIGSAELAKNEEFSSITIERIKQLNISNQSFYISKAEIQVISDEEKENFLVSVKYLFPDKYLISFRSKSGLEGARVFLSGDTILINDRINRNLLYGDPDYIKKKFGISYSALPLFFGDFVFKDSGDQDELKCVNGSIELYSTMHGLKFKSVVDCSLLKLNNCLQFSDMEGEQVIMKYSKYIEIGEVIVPSKIEIQYGKTQVIIAIKKIEIPWKGNFEFLPGSNYEVIPLK